jgi:hypothetical protein
MKNKLVIILAVMLLVVYTIPVLGTTNKIMINQDPDDNYREKVKHLNDGRLPPDPGHIPKDFVFEINDNSQMNPNPPQRNVRSEDEVIIEILENLNEALIISYLEDLTDFGPRVTGSPAVQQAGDYIYNEFVSYGLEARYDPWSYYGYSGNNIEGELEGIDETSDEIYLILAHYDSVSGSPGADDDGSGTAAVLAAAYLLSDYEFNHTIRFLAVDGEEQGLLGSHEYAKEASQNGDNIVAVLNGDMIGYAENPTQASYVKIYEDTASQWITDFTEDVAQDYNDYIELTVVPSGYASNSDHASFWNYNYNAIMYHEYEFNQYYHSSQDIIANMDTDYCTRISKLMVATLADLAQVSSFNTPPEKPILAGPSSGIEGEELTFSATTTDFDGDGLYYKFNWGDGNLSNWIGPYESGVTMQTSYVWPEIGEYDVIVSAKDTNNSQGDWSDPLAVTINDNLPPEKPTISGPLIAQTGKSLEFTFQSTDPEGFDIYYNIMWGDGTYEDYIGPYASGEEAVVNHTYTESGSFNIVVKARDSAGEKSPQTQYKIIILKNRAITSPLLQILERILDNFPLLSKIINL